MTIIDSINNIFSFEKDREYIEELRNLKSEISKLYLFSIVIKKLKMKNKISNFIPNKILFENLVKEKGVLDSRFVKDSTNGIMKLNTNILFSINGFLEEQKSFYEILIELDINTNYNNNAVLVCEILDNIKSNLIFRLIDDDDFKEKKKTFSNLIKDLNKFDMNLSDLHKDNVLFEFINIYYENSNQGKDTTLADIFEIYQKIAKSDIANKIILKFSNI